MTDISDCHFDLTAGRLRSGDYYWASIVGIIGLSWWLAAGPTLFILPAMVTGGLLRTGNGLSWRDIGITVCGSSLLVMVSVIVVAYQYECRAMPKFEEYREYAKSLGLEVFTYIDRVVADKATFLLWLDEQQKAAESAATTLRQMREHPLFPSFCEAVNVTAEQWGQDGNPEHVATEVQFFNEWLAAKEIEQAVGPTFGVSAMDTMETQASPGPTSPGPPTTAMPPPSLPPRPPPPPPMTEDAEITYATEEDVPRPPLDYEGSSPEVRKQLAPVFESAGAESGNNERQQMALAATILKNDPVAFSAALETAPIDELRAVHRALHKTLYGESPPVKVQAPPTTKQVDLVEASVSTGTGSGGEAPGKAEEPKIEEHDKKIPYDIEPDKKKPKEKDSGHESEQDKDKPKEKDSGHESEQDKDKPKEKDSGHESEQDKDKPKDKDSGHESEQEEEKPKEEDSGHESEPDEEKPRPAKAHLPVKPYKYPLDAPLEHVIGLVRGLVSTEDAPRYEDQVGARGKRRAAPRRRQDEDEADEEEGEPIPPDEVVRGMERMCIAEACKEVEAEEVKRGKKLPKGKTAKAAQAKEAQEEEEEEEAEDEEGFDEEECEPPVRTTKAATKKAKSPKNAVEEPEVSKPPKKGKKAKDMNEAMPEDPKGPAKKKKKAEEVEEESKPEGLKGPAKKKKKATEMEEPEDSKGPLKKKKKQAPGMEEEPMPEDSKGAAKKKKKKKAAELEEESEPEDSKGPAKKKKKARELEEESEPEDSKGPKKKKGAELEEESEPEGAKGPAKKKKKAAEMEEESKPEDSKGPKKKKAPEMEEESKPEDSKGPKKKKAPEMEEESKPEDSKGPKKKKATEMEEESKPEDSKGPKKKKKKASEMEEEEPEDPIASTIGKIMKSGPCKGMLRVDKSRFQDCQGVIYSYNIRNETVTQEDLEDEDAGDAEAAAAEAPCKSAKSTPAAKTKSKPKAKGSSKAKATKKKDEEVTDIQRNYIVADLFAGHQYRSWFHPPFEGYHEFESGALQKSFTWLAMFGSETAKPVKLFSDDGFIHRLYRKLDRKSMREKTTKTVRRWWKGNRQCYTGKPKEMKASQIYPPKFGTQVRNKFLLYASVVPKPDSKIVDFTNVECELKRSDQVPRMTFKEKVNLYFAKTKQEPPTPDGRERQLALPAPPAKAAEPCQVLALKKEAPVACKTLTSCPAKAPANLSLTCPPCEADSAGGPTKKAKMVSPPPKSGKVTWTDQPAKASTPPRDPAKATVPSPEPSKAATPSPNPSKAATPSPEPSKAATPSPKSILATPKSSGTPESSDERNKSNQDLLTHVATLYTNGDEMAIVPESYMERQSLYSQFKRLQVRHVRTREEEAEGTHEMGWRTRRQLLQLHGDDSDLVVTVLLGHAEKQRTRDSMQVEEKLEIEAHQAMMGANAMNNMLVNSSHKPIMHTGVPADPNAQTGCLGMNAGGSADPVAAGKGKGGQSMLGHIDELNNSFANLQALTASKDSPETQYFAAVELARQRLELFSQEPDDLAELLISNYAAGSSSAANVQVTADRALKWCETRGGNTAEKDLVWKLSKLATSGKHPQNAERDLHAAVRKYGLKMKINIEYIPVRLFNPSTETIYQTTLPVICPVSLATAIWHEGPDIFESIFLGAEGKDGAQRFWQNAKKNASWFMGAEIPESSFPGLLPIFLYGDDVDAYRNSDAGAISAVGWGCDFGYKREAMLQNFLLAVYAEYTACEHTHDDVMAYAVEKFKVMGDPRINHPWHASGFRFYLSSCRGDLKWINVCVQLFPSPLAGALLFAVTMLIFSLCVWYPRSVQPPGPDEETTDSEDSTFET
ncbi:Neurofilament heavy polypeptide [Symbiodinium microadriaticum]|uniref:Neurofilament heavy polypeptide n=1 Tax=Symbiodinium microadriaticum TaxID=2951 RepID=A0A1Q9E7Y1_SYMMI|nr:Neurofilament heavy polypeptide [Symbiodinium microadriaticum]